MTTRYQMKTMRVSERGVAYRSEVCADLVKRIEPADTSGGGEVWVGLYVKLCRCIAGEIRAMDGTLSAGAERRVLTVHSRLRSSNNTYRF